MNRTVIVAPMALALLALAACSGDSGAYPESAGYAPYYERGIDQDIEATHDDDAPTLRNLGLQGHSTELSRPDAPGD
jgi:hypothetical protein